MACIVYQTDKKTGARYAYESISYWDREKKQPRSKRKYLGVADPESGQIRKGRRTEDQTQSAAEIRLLKSELEAKEKELSELAGRYERTMDVLKNLILENEKKR